MGVKRNRVIFGAVLAAIGTACPGSPTAALVISPLPNAAHEISLSNEEADPSPFEPDPELKVDKAIASFGRLMEKAEAAGQEQIQAQCKAGEPPNQSPAQRYAWAANCQYSRH